MGVRRHGRRHRRRAGLLRRGLAGRAHGVAEIGYWIRAESRNRGIATRAVRLASAVAAEGDVLRLQLRADVENTASQRVAENAGFQREGVLRSVRFSRRKQRRIDFVMYSSSRRKPERNGELVEHERGPPIERFLTSGALSDATRRAYRSDLRGFARWLDQQGLGLDDVDAACS